MEQRLSEEVSITDLFDQFVEASTMRNVLSIHHRILNCANLNPCEFNSFFPSFKRAILGRKARKNWKAKALFSKIDKKAGHRCYSSLKTPTPLGNRNFSHKNHVANSQEYLEDHNQQSSNRYCYNNNALQFYNCLVIGSGPAGLRTAIELQLLGANKVVVVEKRSRFSRNNVLHLWPFVIDDLKSLGAKKFYGKFCAGSIDHISIRQLQLMLLKISLMIGVDFRDSCSYLHLCPATLKPTPNLRNQKVDRTNIETDSDINGQIILEKSSDIKADQQIMGACELDHEEIKILAKNDCLFVKVSDNIESSEDMDDTATTNADQTGESLSRRENLRGVKAHFKSDYLLQEKELHSHEWDIIIGADGRRNTLSRYFPRKEFRGRLAIAITANFINRQTPAEAAVSEISGLSFIYNQDMFNALAHDTGIELENICYYKDDTHYLVMTAKKRSLLERGVLIQDFATTQELLSEDNVDRQALLKYARDAAFWTTGLKPLDFALNHYGQEDCAMFDFTCMYAALNACKALRTSGGGLSLVSLVGDSLLEPFWPTGSGCARGFLSSFDASWMCRQWAYNRCAVIGQNSVSRSSKSRQSSSSNNQVNIEPTTNNRMALSVMAERESIYRILAQTTSENLQQNYSKWTLNPHTRYPNLNRHHVLPSQVEHLISDFEPRLVPSEETRLGSSGATRASVGRRHNGIKSPSSTRSRRSPKKLRSANSSPKTQSKRLGIDGRQKSRSRQDVDSYIQLERSYDFLMEQNGHNRPRYEAFDDLSIPSISGTHPSRNNLQRLEARRARDIDECMRQRRQKTQLTLVRDRFREQFRSRSCARDGPQTAPVTLGGPSLHKELLRLREHRALSAQTEHPQSKFASHGAVGVVPTSPLSLFNTMRRCASFAERVKNFEDRLSVDLKQNGALAPDPAPPRTPQSDSVRNRPQFATLQKFFVNNGCPSNDQENNKQPKMAIMKLSKDDWNVKCWEDRLANRPSLSFGLKSLSLDHGNPPNLPVNRVELFKDRIKEMAVKLDEALPVSKSNLNGSQSVQSHMDFASTRSETHIERSWVSHVKQELVRGQLQPHGGSTRNPAAPTRTIKKLFADDKDDDDNRDPDDDSAANDRSKRMMNENDGHCDHLCINRPINKYLSRNTRYSSRIKYDPATSRVINRASPSIEDKQAFMKKASLTSGGSSSASSTFSSDQSTRNTSTVPGVDFGSASGDLEPQPKVNECARCAMKIESPADMITVDRWHLHQACLSCSECKITLRTNEILHYLAILCSPSPFRQSECRFACVICKPDIRSDLLREANVRSDLANRQVNDDCDYQDVTETDDLDATELAEHRMKSREHFMNSTINYNEVYKNLLDEGRTSEGMSKFNQKLRQLNSRSDHSSNETSKEETGDKIVRATPEHRYLIAESELVDGSEQVTLLLPAIGEEIRASRGEQHMPQSKAHANANLTMVDEDEINRILHLDVADQSRFRATDPISSDDDDLHQDEEEGDDCPRPQDQVVATVEGRCDSEHTHNTDYDPGDQSDESSSLISAPDIDDEDEDSGEFCNSNGDDATHESVSRLTSNECDLGLMNDTS